MGGLWSELGKKLAERWFSLLVLPGALYLAVVVAGVSLGHRHALDAIALTRRITDVVRHPEIATTGGQVLLLAAALAGSAAVGLVVQAIGSLAERAVLAADWQAWPAPARRIAAWRVTARRSRWAPAARAYLDLRADAARARARGTRANPAPREAAYRAMARIAQEHPERPTWSGDRIHAVVIRLERDHHLSLATIWPYLWLTMPENSRAEVAKARDGLSRAASLFGWALLYLVPAAWWWPAAVIGGSLAAAAVFRTRSCADTYAQLLEATARLHSADLATTLGLEPPAAGAGDGDGRPGRLPRAQAEALTLLLGGSPPGLP